MPVKAKAKAKAKKKVAPAPVISEKQVRQILDDQRARAEKKFKYAKRILGVNTPALNETVEQMVESLGRQSQPRLVIDGVYVECDTAELREINQLLHYWVAVRLLVAAAEWDIRISGFKLPKSKCARCGKKVAK